MLENIRNTVQTIGTTAVEILPTLLYGQRNALTFINTSTSAQIITLSWGTSAVLGAGVVLFPGGSWSESKDSIFTPSNAQVWAISNGAAGTIAIHERVAAGGP